MIEIGLAIHTENSLVVDQFDFSGSERLALEQMGFADFGEDDLQEIRNRRAEASSTH
jgi:hypothetical protein